MSPLKKTSKGGEPVRYLTESLLGVIDMDAVAKRKDVKKLFSYRQTVATNDAYYESPASERFFIEFKSGGIDRGKLLRKMEGSKQLSVQLKCFANEDEVRLNVHYILVYDANKHQEARARAGEAASATPGPAAPSLSDAYDYWTKRSTSRTLTLFGVEAYEGVYCKSAETMTVEEFQQHFVEPMERLDPVRIPTSC